MKKIKLTVITTIIIKCVLFLFPLSTWSQNDSLAQKVLDSVYLAPGLKEIIITNRPKLTEDQKRKIILNRRIHRVYPYARLTASKLLELNQQMEQLSSKRKKRKYLKKIEKFLREEFEPKLKKLSRNDGKILVKLIHRQTGFSTYQLIKDYKSGWKAFWSNNTAKLFSINLKSEYNPFENEEDYIIEGLLHKAFYMGRLKHQNPAIPIDQNKLLNHWLKKRSNLEPTLKSP